MEFKASLMEFKASLMEFKASLTEFKASLTEFKDSFTIILAIANSRAISNNKLSLRYKGGNKTMIKKVRCRNNYGIKAR